MTTLIIHPLQQLSETIKSSSVDNDRKTVAFHLAMCLGFLAEIQSGRTHNYGTLEAKLEKQLLFIQALCGREFIEDAEFMPSIVSSVQNGEGDRSIQLDCIKQVMDNAKDYVEPCRRTFWVLCEVIDILLRDYPSGSDFWNSVHHILFQESFEVAQFYNFFGDPNELAEFVLTAEAESDSFKQLLQLVDHLKDRVYILECQMESQMNSLDNLKRSKKRKSKKHKKSK